MAPIFSNSPDSALFLLLLLETIIGTFCNAIVMGIILKGKKLLKTGNIIRISLNTSNVCYSVIVFFSVFSGILGSGNVKVTNSTLAYVVYALNTFALNSSSWLTAILSLFYFIKIMDFKTRTIVWTKRNIDTLIPWMIMGVEVVAFFSSFLGMLIYIKPQRSSLNDSMITLNNSVSNTHIGFLSTVLIVSSVPFLTIVITTVCMAGTLKKHSHNMMKKFKTINDKHVKRFRNTVFKIKRLLVVYSFYYLCALLFYFAIAAQLRVQFWVFLLMLSSFTMVHSVLLVIGNPKLQESAKEMLQCTICSQQMNP
uniref:Taste receptor type 2 n=1 Tax=Pyxicephalus adspersus TaxID=30357 RepID=A0AAV3AAM5_PYXAD|nr:TPA: hypothetical protein GDO54_014786 [Pyxicephalus adspersus]